ncbi:hypothetical protein [Neomegalonema sp.]|uniref:hypothetical protein n=1 Tax=Neomegalonema sp. TaxID=2039713 RepID=UPI002638E4A8|nr:hypothetical protein [Neomegalonema sp.]MDD2869711.1 hypothetical protein [Neomegalonema sp.]
MSETLSKIAETIGGAWIPVSVLLALLAILLSVYISILNVRASRRELRELKKETSALRLGGSRWLSPYDEDPRDLSGNLTPEDRERVGAWLKERTPLIGKCPICGDRHWILGDHFINAPVYHSDGPRPAASPIYPEIALVCGNCGFSAFLNATLIGGLSALDPPNPNLSTEGAAEKREPL